MSAAPKATPATTPRYVVAGDTFIWRSDDPDVGEVRVPLKFKGKILKAAMTMRDDELAFMFYVLHGIGIPESTTDEIDAGEMRALFQAWQVAWSEHSEATFPQS